MIPQYVNQHSRHLGLMLVVLAMVEKAALN